MARDGVPGVFFDENHEAAHAVDECKSGRKQEQHEHHLQHLQPCEEGVLQQKNVAGKRDERHDKNDVEPLELPHIHGFMNGVQHPSHDDGGDDPPEEFEL